VVAVSVQSWLSIAALHTSGPDGAAADFDRMADHYDRLAGSSPATSTGDVSATARELRAAAAWLRDRGRSR
jgi:hypothetical protein